MIATLNCLAFVRIARLFREVESLLLLPARAFLICLIAGLAFVTPVSAQVPSSNDSNEVVMATFAARAEEKFKATRILFEKKPRDTEAGLNFGRACFDWADFAGKNKQRESIALMGIAACRAVIEQNPKSAGGHYYLAMNVGQLARTKTIGALRLVDQMEAEFKLARSLDSKYDFAGPERNLGLLYAEAPGWPASIGDRSKARQHLQRAVILHPDYPENHLNLLEASLKWNDATEARRRFTALTNLWPQAKKELTGKDWEPSWADWTKRMNEARKKVSELPKATASPERKK